MAHDDPTLLMQFGEFTDHMTQKLEQVEQLQQHLTFTTQLPGEAEIDQRHAAQLVA